MKRLILYFLVLSSLCATAQRKNSAPSLKLDEKNWWELAEGHDYSEDFETPQPKDKDSGHGGGPATAGSIGEFKYLIYLAVLGLIVFFVVRLLRSADANPAVQETGITTQTLDKIEERLHETDLEEMLQQALDTKNFRIALRIHFLIIIKLLSATGKIKWSKDKTNWEYHAELRDRLTSDKFAQAIRIFENAWYGEHDFDELSYHRNRPVYIELQKQLSQG
jgi:hypothetical protein